MHALSLANLKFQFKNEMTHYKSEVDEEDEVNVVSRWFNKMQK